MLCFEQGIEFADVTCFELNAAVSFIEHALHVKDFAIDSHDHYLQLNVIWMPTFLHNDRRTSMETESRILFWITRDELEKIVLNHVIKEHGLVISEGLGHQIEFSPDRENACSGHIITNTTS